MASIREGSDLSHLPDLGVGPLVIRCNARNGLKVIGIVSFGLLAAWSLVLCVGILSRVAGATGVGVGLAVFPLTFACAPWYALVAQGDPTLLVIEYAGMPAVFVLYGIAHLDGSAGARHRADARARAVPAAPSDTCSAV